MFGDGMGRYDEDTVPLEEADYMAQMETKGQNDGMLRSSIDGLMVWVCEREQKNVTVTTCTLVRARSYVFKVKIS